MENKINALIIRIIRMLAACLDKTLLDQMSSACTSLCLSMSKYA